MHELEDKRLYGAGGHHTPERGAGIIPDVHYAAIGKVVDAWADLEFEIDRTIWELQGVPQTLGACVTAQLVSILPKLDALRALARHLGFSERVEGRLGTLHGVISPLVGIRNRIVHDKRFIWYSQGEVARFRIIPAVP